MSQPGALGVRLTFHHDYDESWIRDGRQTGSAGRREDEHSGDVERASIHKDVAGVAERHPNLRLILDHMGRLKGMKDDKLGLGLAPTLGLAKYHNVFVKLTSVPSSSSESYPYRNVHPHLKRLIDAFGPRRCFWGTDLSAMLSRTNCTYRQAVTMFRGMNCSARCGVAGPRKAFRQSAAHHKFQILFGQEIHLLGKHRNGLPIGTIRTAEHG